MGHISDFKATMLVREGTKPKLCKVRSVPLAMKLAIEEEMARLERIGILMFLMMESAIPVVAVPKKDGTV